MENIPSKDYDNYFCDIAEILMNKCYIQKGDTNYQIIEIEFYLYTPTHTDVITYPREIEAGRWFFHQSGVDLTFNSDGNSFGGILIRGLKSLNNGKLILGPMKCEEVLWDEFDAFAPKVEDYPRICIYEGNITSDIPHAYKRWIPLSFDERESKLNDWASRLPQKNSRINLKELDEIVFESNYRFIMEAVIDFESQAWKKYRAKPTQLPCV